MTTLLATLSDKNYLAKGIALYQSLLTHTKDFTLYYLCLDNETLSYFSGKPNVITIQYSDLPNSDRDLIEHNTASVPNGFSTFHFSLASTLSDYLLNTTPYIIYLDSDIFTYADLSIIPKLSSQYDCGLIRHRHLPFGHKVGYYNVGLIYLTKPVASFWKDCVIQRNTTYLSSHGQTGDQKYLELFPRIFNSLDLDIHIGHLAPWNIYVTNFLSQYQILYEDKIQQILFFHFSQFHLHGDSFKTDYNNAWLLNLYNYDNTFLNAFTENLYNDYFLTIKSISSQLKL